MLHSDTNVKSGAHQSSSTLIDIIRKQALHRWNRVAYTFLVDGETEKIELTYGELDRRSRAIGAQLQLAEATGGRVLLLYPHGLEFITAFLGCLYAGAIAVPAYPPRLNRSQIRLQKIIEDSQAAIVLTKKSVLPMVERVFGESYYKKDVRWLATEDIADELEEKWREPAVDGDTLAMIQYTSGSTAAPKGVKVSHHNLISNERMIQEAFRQTENSIIVGWLPLYHDMGLIGNVLQPLYLGARCVLMSPTSFLQKPARWLQAISDYRATTSGGPNFAYDLCVRKISPDERTRFDLASWTTAFNGAEPIFLKTMERFASTFADCGFRREAFFPCYGLAEATLLVSAGSSEAQSGAGKKIIEQDHSLPATADKGNRMKVGCGYALPSERVVIVDPESLTQYSDERIGEIWVSGPNVARGYWNRDLETQQTFGAYLEEAGEGPFLRTGDLGYIKDGELFVAGRIKDLIIIRGRNHYPQDLELTVQQSDPALESGNCAAFSIEASDEERLVIVKELSRKTENTDFLIKRVREAVAREHEIQAYAIVLITKGSIPKTTSGKIQRHECRKLYQAGRLAVIAEWHENSTSGLEPVVLPSANNPVTLDVEAIESIRNSLLSFLAAKLRLGVEQIDIDEPLLRYGVDSITAIELSHYLESRFGIALSSADLLEQVTIAQLARETLDRLEVASCYTKPSFTPISRGVTEHPLSYGQRSLWLLYQFAPLSGAYNVSLAVRIRSALNVTALRGTLRKIVDRHDSLRTTFISRVGAPLQKIHETFDICLSETEVSSWSDEYFDNHLVLETHRAFDLEQGPLLRVNLFRRSPEDHVLLIVAHHIVVDLWSLGVLIHEFGLFYRAELDSTAAPLNPLPIHYAEYVYRQAELLAGQKGEQLWLYWKSRLAGELGALNLPTDRPRPQLQTYRGDSQPISFSLDHTQAIKSLGQNHRATLYITLQAIFQALLHRYTSQEDILIGVPTAGRNSAELATLIGYFVNPIVLRADLSGNPTFTAFLERVREETLDDFAHQEYPFALLVERLQPERDPSRSPLFQVMFALQSAPAFGKEGSASDALTEGAQLNFGGLSAESMALRRRASYFDLSLFLVETVGGLKGYIEYNVDLFDEWRIRRMAEHFQTLTKSIIATPERRIHDLELMSSAEKEQVIVEFNRTRREYGPGQCIHELIEAQVERRGHEIALIYQEARVSYEELNRKANQLARYLFKLGIGLEDRVGICVKRRTEMIVGLLGILKAGGAYLPLDPGYPRERLEYMLKDAAVKALVTDDRLKELFAGHEQDTILLDSDWPLIAQESSRNPGRKILAENLAYILYTSGSTGKPKGVAITHRSVVTLLKWAEEVFSEEELKGVLASTSISFDLSVFELMAPLSRGGKVVLAENALELPALIAAKEVRLINTVPSAIRELVGRLGMPESIETVNLAGEVLRNDLAQQIYERGNIKRVLNLYGPTEDTTYSTFTIVDRGADEEPTLGRPISNTAVYILDNEMASAPVGAYGEICISGDGLARCYFNRPELTAEKFLPNPLGTGEGARLYRTGDVGRHARDGSIEYKGRGDHQVKLRGYRIELGEIERVLEQKEWVRESVVVMREGDLENKQLVAYIVADGERKKDAKVLRTYLEERLPNYAVPSAIVMLEKMPLTPNGKLDREALPWPRPEGGVDEPDFVAPLNVIDEIVVGIFREVLRLDRVGVHDNFFEIGGHSLLATRVISRVRNTFGVEVEVRSLFEEPTVEGLARRIQEAIRTGEKSQGPPLVRISREGQNAGRLPLSFAQQRLWFIDQLVPNNPLYNIPGGVRLEGSLDLEILESVINEIIRRQEVLRTRIEVKDGEPIQVIEPWEPRELEVEDLRSLSREEKESEVRRITRAEAGRGFDLSRGPLLRVKALKLAEEEHALLFTMHHIVSDGWSMGVLAREVCDLYEAMSEGRPSPLPELEIQYADYAKWQREYLSGEVLEKEVGYWKERLKDAAVMELPTDRARPAAPSYRGGRERVEIGKELSQELRRLSQREGATLFMVLMAAFKLILMRYSGEEDVSVGTVIANRTRREVEGLIGFFVNTLVLRTDLGGNPSFAELMRREREVSLGAYGHQEAPFEKLVEEINPDRDLSRSPLFQVMMALQNTRREEMEIRGLKVIEQEVETGVSKFDLTLGLTEAGEGIVGSLEYSEELYDGETIRRMARHYEKVLEEVVRNAERRIRQIELLGEAEKRQITEEWNETERKYEEARLAHEMIRDEARRNPEAVAVNCEHRQLSYRELNRRANQLGQYLMELGVGPDVRVGICLERSIELIVGMLGILKAGGAYVPMDTSFPASRLKMIAEDAEIRFLITEEKLAGRYAARTAKQIWMDRDWRTISMGSGEDFQSAVTEENAAYVIYTSGSTGRPKGVLVTHRSVRNLFNALNERMSFGEKDVWSCSHSYAFDFSVWEIWGALIYGGRLALATELVARAPEEFYDLIGEEGVTILSQTPSAFRQLIKVDEVAGAGRKLNLRAVVFGGEALEYQSLKGWIERRGDESPALINMYGITETTVHTTYKRVKSEELKEAVGSVIGEPLANIRMSVLDEYMEPAPVGVIGELYVGGEGLARGYLGKEELTAERFLPCPKGRQAGERIYKTGDLGRYGRDGKIEYLGRRDHQVKIRGYRIELGEIETALLEQEAIREAVVVVTGEGEDKALAAYLVSAGGERLRMSELKRSLRERVPDYMLPGVFVQMERLPLTPNGKLDRQSLPSPRQAREDGESESEEPRTAVEEMVAGIYKEVLKQERVGRGDNFFEIGGHSLLATQVISRVREVFGVEIGVRSVFEEGTVEGLSRKVEERLREGEKVELPPLVRASREGQRERWFPLSYAQQRLWFIEQLEPGTGVYNIAGIVRLEGELDLVSLEWSVNELVRRHEVLRTRIEIEENEPAQVIDEWRPWRLEVEELRSVTEEEKEEEVRRKAREEAETGFDLSRGRPLRVKVLKLGGAEYVLLFTMHHIVSDGWSMGILVREVGALYRARRAGEASPLEELPIQYADFAVWQRQRLRGEALEHHLAYWKRKLGGQLPMLALPTDKLRPAVQTRRGAQRSHMLPAMLSSSLKELSQNQGCTLFMTLLAAFSALLYYLTGQNDITVGTDIANRNRAETEKLIGLFVNQLVMRVELSPDSTFEALLRNVREVALGAYTHQDLPFEKLVEALNPDRNVNHTPLFRVKMVLQNVPAEKLSLSGLTTGPVIPITGAAKFDLLLDLFDTDRGLHASLQYNTGLFEENTIIRILNRFHILLDRIVGRPNARLQTLVEPLFEEDRRAQLVKVEELERIRLRTLKSVKRKEIGETHVEAGE
jgi:amino acid adenylation domain-containing protein